MLLWHGLSKHETTHLVQLHRCSCCQPCRLFSLLHGLTARFSCCRYGSLHCCFCALFCSCTWVWYDTADRSTA